MVKLNIEVPKEMYNIASQENIVEHPYDLCLHCPFIQKTCDGPNVLAMEYPRWVEWANERAHQLGLTRAKIAELSNLPKGTVDSVMAGRGKDLRSATLRDITKVLIGGCWGQYPCHFAALLMKGELAEEGDFAELGEELAETRKRLEDAEQENKNLWERLAWLEDRDQAAKEEAQKKVDYLKARIEKADEAVAKRDKMVSSLLIALGVVLGFILILFGIDFSIGSVGWFRY